MGADHELDRAHRKPFCISPISNPTHSKWQHNCHVTANNHTFLRCCNACHDGPLNITLTQLHHLTDAKIIRNFNNFHRVDEILFLKFIRIEMSLKSASILRARLRPYKR